MVTVALLAFIAVSSLSGLLGAAQVDYSAGLVHSAMENTSTTFHMVQVIAKDSHHDSEFIRQTMDSFVTSFNETDIPHEAFELSVEALR
jgi:hypothetical protein